MSDNFSVKFKNLIDDALDTWQKTKLAPYFEGTNNDFLRKVTDINAPCFRGQQNWTLGLSK